MLDHYAFQIRIRDASTEDCLQTQCTDASSPLYGTIVDFDHGLDHGSTGIAIAKRLITAFCVPGSAYHGSLLLLDRAADAVRHTLSRVNEDGTLDLLTTNFHDASETAFTMQNAGIAYLMLRDWGGDSPNAKTLLDLLYRFVDRSADGMLSGGFHTPNHRWVQSSALALCWKITGRTECLDRMNAFLNEGIDCDASGEYTERSSGVYNIVCDRSFILLSETLDRPEFLTCVERNLGMVQAYFEPDHTVNTLNSSRQDAGTAPDWRIYYSCYLYMALRTGRTDFAWIADEMLRQSSGEALNASQVPGPGYDFWYYYLRDSSSHDRMIQTEAVKPPVDFERFFENSGIVRARHGDVTLTLVRDQPLFAMLRFGTHPLWLRLAASFYAKAQFAAQSICRTEDGWRMRYSVRWGYKRPLPVKPETSDWRKMDHSLREDVFMQDFSFDVAISFRGDEAVFRVSAEGQKDVPVKLELMMESGAQVFCNDLILRARPGDYLYQKCDRVLCRYPDSFAFEVTGGFFAHTFGEDMRGSLPGDDKHFFLCETAFSPCERTLSIRTCRCRY